MRVVYHQHFNQPVGTSEGQLIVILIPGQRLDVYILCQEELLAQIGKHSIIDKREQKE